MKHLKKQTLILLSIASLIPCRFSSFCTSPQKGGKTKLLQP